MIRLPQVATITFAILAFIFSTSVAQPLNLRYPAPSPDGSRICFSYMGDLWIVSGDGGRAERLTVHEGYDGYPHWSPDGSLIAFSSRRYGNFDIFVVAATGGMETRLTFHSDDDIVSGWSADGKTILFTSQRESSVSSIWEIPRGGGRALPLLRLDAFAGRKSPDGKKLLFTRGAVPWWRKGYRGSAGCDIFLKDLGSGEIKSIVTSPANDLDGYFTPNGADIVYVTDSTGVYNLFRRNLSSGAVTQLTNHRFNVSHPALSLDGSLAAYELNGEIFLYDLNRGQGRKLLVEIATGDRYNDELEFTTSGAVSEIALSPDGAQLAFVSRGQVFCWDVMRGRGRQLTSGAATKQEIAWSSDSRELFFSSSERGTFDAYSIRSSDPSRQELSRSHDVVVDEVVTSDRFCRLPQPSPDGSKIAFVRGETDLVAMDRKRKTERTVSSGTRIREYSWSPDGRFIVFSRLANPWMSELFVGDSESGTTERISSAPGSFRAPQFSPNGKIIYYLDGADLFCILLERRLATMDEHQLRSHLQSEGQNNVGRPMPVAIDFDDIQRRHIRLTHNGSVEAAVASSKSPLIIFSAAGQIMAVDWLGRGERHIAEVGGSIHDLQLAPDNQWLYCLSDRGEITMLDLNNSSLSAFPVQMNWSVSRRALYEQTLIEFWTTIRERFYDPAYHGVNWNSLREQYLPRVRAVRDPSDFEDLLREMAGELNASHIDIWSDSEFSSETGFIGVIPDYSDNSAGMIALEVLDGSPAATPGSQIEVFDKITAVDGQKIKAGESFYIYLAGTGGREVKLDLINRRGISRSVFLAPISGQEFRILQNHDSVERTKRVVSRQSNKRIAYTKLSQITEESVDRFEEDLRSFPSDVQSLIVDLRGNSGGSEHDRLLQLLARRRYVAQRPRSGAPGYDSPTAIAGATVLLVDERTSSDAEIVALGFRSLGIGEIVGTVTYGAVIGAEKCRLPNGSTMSIPTLGWYDLQGKNLENRGVQPDHVVPLNLTRAEKGEDNQLEAAVQLLLGKMR